MYYKIYFNDKPLFLTSEISPDIEPFVHHDDAVLIDEFSTPGVNSMIHEMRQEKVHAGIYQHTHLEELKKAFWKKFTVIKAAGGLVLNRNQEILLMYRRGKWDLPKGKLDKGETIEQCAIRETEEETGLRNVQLGKHLLTTYHTYDESGRHLLKETYWYHLFIEDLQTLTPQTEEQIEEVKWVKPADLGKYMMNSYPSIEEVLRKAGYEWGEK